MKSFKWSKLISISLAALVVVSSIGNTMAATYEMWLSRDTVDWSDPHLLADAGTFDAKAYCNSYLYLNHNIGDTSGDFTQSRGNIEYNSSELTVNSVFVNEKETGAQSTAWWVYNDNGTYTAIGGNPLLRMGLNVDDPGAPASLPYTFTLGRLGVINQANVANSTLNLYVSDPSTVEGSTHMDVVWGLNNLYGTFSYSVDVDFYAEPCIPDGPITSSMVAPINGKYDNSQTLARVPSVNGQSVNLTAGKPITQGSADLTNTSNFLPAQVTRDATVDSGIFLVIKEPSDGAGAHLNAYGYTSGAARGNNTGVLVDATYTNIGGGLTNQWGIDPASIWVEIDATFTDRTDLDDAGTACTFTVAGADLWLTDIGSKTWNQNELWYNINITQATIQNLAKTNCPGLAAVATGNVEYKRETSANIEWYAKDLSNSRVITQDYNTVLYSVNDGEPAAVGSANEITGVTGYAFNGYTDNPVLSMDIDGDAFTNSADAATAKTNNLINKDNNSANLNFTTTDDWAGIDSSTIVVTVNTYESSAQEYGLWWDENGVTPTTYIFSGVDLNLSTWNDGNGDRDDYTGSIDLSTISLNTGMFVTIHMTSDDYVGNTNESYYAFKTKPWPKAPEADPTLTQIQGFNGESISTFNFVDSIYRTLPAPNTYSYDTHYPDPKALIADYRYQGSNAVQELSLNAENGNSSSPQGNQATLTGLFFDGSNGTVSGTVYVSGMTHETTFSFDVTIENIYGITSVETYTIKIFPSCTDSPGCINPIHIYWGKSVADAKAMEAAAAISGTEANYWYDYWFAELRGTSEFFYFSGVDGGTNTALFCAGTGDELTLTQGNYSGPEGDTNGASPYNDYTQPTLPAFTGTQFTISGDANIRVDYELTPTEIEGKDALTLYVVRPLTGKLEYSHCQFTGGVTFDEFGCAVTGDINWTKLNNGETFAMTARVEGGWFTGQWVGEFIGQATWDSQALWWTSTVYHGWGKRFYTNATGNAQETINTSGLVQFTIENRLWETDLVDHEIYWIDTTEPYITDSRANFIPNRSIDLVLTSNNTGQLFNTTSGTLVQDDEFMITAFSGTEEPQLYTTSGFGYPMTAAEYIADPAYNSRGLSQNIKFWGQWSGDIYFIDRAGNTGFISIEMTEIQARKEFTVIARPAFRPDNQYAVTSGDFWMRVQSGSTWTQNYNSNVNPSTDPVVTLNNNGTGSVTLIAPASGDVYLVAYKGSGLLSVWYTGVFDDSLTTFDLTDGTNPNLTLNYSSDYNPLVYQNVVYMKPADVIADGTGTYDQVVASTDLAAINTNLTVGATPLAYSRYDFDLNGVIAAPEQAIIIQSLLDLGFIGWVNDLGLIPMTDFVTNF